MKKVLQHLTRALPFLPAFLLFSCHENNGTPTAETINAINLKRGEIILCGAPKGQLGHADFETSCKGQTKEDFDLAIELLHSF